MFITRTIKVDLHKSRSQFGSSWAQVANQQIHMSDADDDSDCGVALRLVRRGISDDGISAALAVIDGIDKKRKRDPAKARYAKLKKQKTNVPEHARRKIEQYNRVEAYHNKDTINVDATSAPKLGGARQNKVLPGGILRICFGRLARSAKCNRPGEQRRRLKRALRGDGAKRRKQLAAHPRGQMPLAVSTSSAAKNLNAGTDHTQKLRNAVAQLAYEKGNQTIASLPKTEHGTVEVALDETEHTVLRTLVLALAKKTMASHLTKSLCMLHAYLTWLIPGSAEAQCIEVPLPPCLMPDASASSFVACVNRRFRWELLDGKATRLTFLYSSDSGTSLAPAFRETLRIIKRRLPNTRVNALHLKCFLHKQSTSTHVGLKPVDLIGKLFCATTMLHRGCVFEEFVENVRAIIDRLDLTFDGPSEADRAHKRAVLTNLVWNDPTLADDELGLGARRHDAISPFIEKLVTVDATPMSSDVLLYFIEPGRALTKLEAQDDYFQTLMAILFHRIPGVPRVNNWLNLFPCFSWWDVSIRWHNIGKLAWRMLPGVGDGLAGLIDAELVFGIPTSDTEKAIIRSRKRKATNMVGNPETPDKLCASTLLLKISMHTTGYLFRNSRMTRERGFFSVNPGNTSGPFSKTIEYVFERLMDLAHPFWTPLTGGAQWTPQQMQIVTDTYLRFVGSIRGRILELILQYPIRASGLVNDAPLATRVARQEELRDIKRRNRRCCCDEEYTWDVVDDMTLEEDLTSRVEGTGLRVYRAFQRLPPSNLMSEIRFGRTTTHTQAAKRGRRPKVSTICAKHSLAELFSAWSRVREAAGVRRYLEEGGAAATAELHPTSSSLGPWQLYFTEQMGIDRRLRMQTIAAKWNGFVAHQRKPYEDAWRKLREETDIKEVTAPVLLGGRDAVRHRRRERAHST